MPYPARALGTGGTFYALGYIQVRMSIHRGIRNMKDIILGLILGLAANAVILLGLSGLGMLERGLTHPHDILCVWGDKSECASPR